MKNSITVRIASMAIITVLLFTNCELKNETKKPQKSVAIVENKKKLDARKKWEASPDGIKYKEWETSEEGKKIHASYDKIKKSIKDFTEMEAVVTSVTFQRENASSNGPKWLIVQIDGEEYMMQFGSKEFEKLNSLNVNDKITVKSRSAGFSNNHPYLIISSDYIAKNNTVLYKRDLSKNKGC